MCGVYAGGLQTSGESLIDIHQIESQVNAPGLGLLPLVTTFETDKTSRLKLVIFRAPGGPWSGLSGVGGSGYQIHGGQTAQHPAMAAMGDVAGDAMPDLGWQNTAGNVLGVYLHGLFEDVGVLRALYGAAATSPDDVFDRLIAGIQADFILGSPVALVG